MTDETQRALVLTSSEIKLLLPMTECIELMAEALKDLARGEITQPLRSIVKPIEALGVMAMMPAYRSSPRSTYGLKAICFFHQNPKLGKDAHQGCVLVFSGTTGELLAIMNATAITELRTAAVSAVATRLLSRSDAGVLGIIGSGVQARAHLKSLSAVRSIKRARIFSPNPQHRERLVDEMRELLPFPLEAVSSGEEALAGADLILTATSSRQPVIKREWVAPGAHINAIGSYSLQSREIDSATMAAASIFVDRRESALNESGDYAIAVKEGFIPPDSIRGEIGEVLLGQIKGRSSVDEITLFKSLGLAIEDLACAEFLFEKAQAEGVGTRIQL